MFDLKRYQGRWFELGKYAFSYETGCENAVADYSLGLDDEGDVIMNVVNTCYIDRKPARASRGIAWQPKNLEGTKKFKIIFETGPNSFEDSLVSDYWVLDTDYETYAFVGGPSPDVFWMLSRTPQVS